MKSIMTKIILLSIGLLTFYANTLKGQCIDNLNLGADTNICAGQSVQLNAGTGYWQYLWSNGSTANNITVNTSGDYWVKARFKSPSNLVINGDFTYGNFYLSTNYTLGTGGPWGILSYEGTYAMTTNSNLVHTNFASCTDHTSGTGQMMVVNGSSVLNQAIWYQTIYVQPNTDYAFSAWFTSVISASPAVLNFRINGNPIGPLVNVSSVTCNWQNFYQLWNSGTSTTATISITNQNNSGGGNDFAMDDIFFGQICDFYDTIHVQVLPYPAVNLGNDTILCASDSLLLDASNVGSSYLWNTGATSQQIYAVQNGNYKVMVSNQQCSSSDSIAITHYPSLTASITADTTMCTAVSKILVVSALGGNGPYSYLWNDGSTNDSLFINPSQTTSYKVTVMDQCQDSVVLTNIVTISDAWFKGFGDTVCKGDTAFLSVQHYHINSILWPDGQTTYDIVIPNADENSYFVQMTDIFGCPHDTILKIELSQAFNLITTGDTIVCKGMPLTLKAYNGNTFLWDNNSTQNTRPVQTLTDGSYWVIGADAYSCKDSNAIKVTVVPYPDPLTVDVPKDSLCRGETILISAYGADYYEWSTGAIGNSIVLQPLNPVNQYSLLGYFQDNYTRCADSLYFKIVSSNCNHFYIPTAFSPNGDGLNDQFGVDGQVFMVESYHIYIYDRWGNLVFQSEKVFEHWDGTINKSGQKVADVYSYIVKIKEPGRDEYSLIGTVHLVL